MPCVEPSLCFEEVLGGSSFVLFCMRGSGPLDIHPYLLHPTLNSALTSSQILASKFNLELFVAKKNNSIFSRIIWSFDSGAKLYG